MTNEPTYFKGPVHRTLSIMRWHYFRKSFWKDARFNSRLLCDAITGLAVLGFVLTAPLWYLASLLFRLSEPFWIHRRFTDKQIAALITLKKEDIAG